MNARLASFTGREGVAGEHDYIVRFAVGAVVRDFIDTGFAHHIAALVHLAIPGLPGMARARRWPVRRIGDETLAIDAGMKASSRAGFTFAQRNEDHGDFSAVKRAGKK